MTCSTKNIDFSHTKRMTLYFWRTNFFYNFAFLFFWSHEFLLYFYARFWHLKIADKLEKNLFLCFFFLGNITGIKMGFLAAVCQNQIKAMAARQTLFYFAFFIAFLLTLFAASISFAIFLFFFQTVYVFFAIFQGWKHWQKSAISEKIGFLLKHSFPVSRFSRSDTSFFCDGMASKERAKTNRFALGRVFFIGLGRLLLLRLLYRRRCLQLFLFSIKKTASPQRPSARFFEGEVADDEEEEKNTNRLPPFFSLSFERMNQKSKQASTWKCKKSSKIVKKKWLTVNDKNNKLGDCVPGGPSHPSRLPASEVKVAQKMSPSTNNLFFCFRILFFFLFLWSSGAWPTSRRGSEHTRFFLFSRGVCSLN